MPIYGKEKTFHMVRSILPSTGRKRAKYAKDHLHRENRRFASTHYAQYKGLSSYVEDLYEDDHFDHDYWVEPHRTGWDSIIYDRRGADKLSHFEKWAYEKTKHIRREDRFSKIAGILPDGVIGEHALSHLDFLHVPYEGRYSYRREEDIDLQMMPWRLYVRHRQSSAISPHKMTFIELANAIRELKTDHGAIRKFNEFMIAHPVVWIKVNRMYIKNFETREFEWREVRERVEDPVDLIHGYHDIESWIGRNLITRRGYIRMSEARRNLYRRYFNLK